MIQLVVLFGICRLSSDEFLLLFLPSRPFIATTVITTTMICRRMKTVISCVKNVVTSLSLLQKLERNQRALFILVISVDKKITTWNQTKTATWYAKNVAMSFPRKLRVKLRVAKQR